MKKMRWQQCGNISTSRLLSQQYDVELCFFVSYFSYYNNENTDRLQLQ
ncbi:hypothetical protein C823_006451 [Eubacterium plexicaudatum ASF492]|nr:hypothetical protein C823_006451 [Eubacterium plexicaudatum ASF492]